jgi:hypothetical protein
MENLFLCLRWACWKPSTLPNPGTRKILYTQGRRAYNQAGRFRVPREWQVAGFERCRGRKWKPNCMSVCTVLVATATSANWFLESTKMEWYQNCGAYTEGGHCDIEWRLLELHECASKIINEVVHIFMTLTAVYWSGATAFQISMSTKPLTCMHKMNGMHCKNMVVWKF